MLILCVPLVSAIGCGIFGRKLGGRGVSIFSSGCLAISMLVSLYILVETAMGVTATYMGLWRWFDTGLLGVKFGLQFDLLTAMMLVVITSISFLVHVYSTGYMANDPHIPRFMSYLSLFTFLMVVLVTSDNYAQLFIGWEGVGLCSYLLINFWYTRMQANQAAMKAMLVNRVGDIGLVLAMIKMVQEYGGLQYSLLEMICAHHSSLSVGEDNGLMVIGFLLFIGAVGKSAQLGLHTWLPDAMEGPTPVSALIHAATMVTAGVFLIIRSASIFECSPPVLTGVTLIGALTALFAATVGVVQNDLKKVIAYSTCSQLGYMVMVCGLSHYSVGLFHLVNHAFFKALLFLSAGSVIHAISDEQDMRRMGGLLPYLPFTYAMMLIGSLSLMGFPYLTGFYSKDLILELAHNTPTVGGVAHICALDGDTHVFVAGMLPTHYMVLAYWLGTFSALLTAYYSIRLIYLTFMTDTNSNSLAYAQVHESGYSITMPLLVLAFGSIGVGYLGKELALSNTIAPIIPNYIKVGPLLCSVLGALIAYIICNWALGLVEKVPVTLGRISDLVANEHWVKVPGVR